MANARSWYLGSTKQRAALHVFGRAVPGGGRPGSPDGGTFRLAWSETTMEADGGRHRSNDIGGGVGPRGRHADRASGRREVGCEPPILAAAAGRARRPSEDGGDDAGDLRSPGRRQGFAVS